MAISKTNRITGHEINIMTPTPAEPDAFGWIRLLNGDADAGYIYLVTPPVNPRMSHDGSYIVTSMPMSELQVLLTILRSEAILIIRYFDPQSDGVFPSVFIEEESEKNVAPGNKMNVPDEVAKEILNLRSL